MAWHARAFVNILGAAFAAVSDWTVACKAARKVGAHAAIVARARLALVNVLAAGGSPVARGTLAHKSVVVVNANAAVVAGIAGTLICCPLAVVALESKRADAAIDAVTIGVYAYAAILARRTSTLIKVNLAVCAAKALRTCAFKLAYMVVAGAAILTDDTITLVNFGFAALAYKSCRAAAGKPGNTWLIFNACCAVEAGIAGALKLIFMAVGASPALGAIAPKRAEAVNTDAVILTWCQGALVDIDLAERALKAFGTTTPEGIGPVYAARTVEARITRALVRLFAALANKTGHTCAAELGNAVDADTTVSANVGRLQRTLVNVNLAAAARVPRRTRTAKASD